jgi:ParB family chromosome partitioning protein
MASDPEEHRPTPCGSEQYLLWQFQAVELQRIDPEDATFRITTQADVSPLAASVRRLGLLVPPLLTPRGERLVVVSGFRRIEACRRIGAGMLPARLTLPHTGPLEWARCAISENILQRDLNPVEISRSLALLEGLGMTPQRCRETARQLGLPATEDSIARLKPVCRMADALQSGILSGAIALPVAEELARREPAEALRLGKLLFNLRVSLNKQREILLLLDEISRRENRPIEAVLDDPGAASILASEESDHNQRTAALRHYLRVRRYPALNRARRRFESELRRLRLGDGMQLNAPKDFEGTTYRLTLNFDSPERLESLVARLPEIVANPALSRILERENDEPSWD